MRRTCPPVLALALALVLAAALTAAHTVHGQPPADPRLSRGIGQVDEGDYDGALVTLDALVRELAASPGRATDLAQAYLYLGVAYLAKGHETSAKARFREALGQAGDLRLSTDKFAPRVVELFEKAREESRQDAPAPAPTPKPGRSKALPILIGAAVAGGGAAALAAGGGGGGAGTGNGTASDPVATAPLNFTGQLGSRGEAASFPVGPFRAGACEAALSWSDGRTEVRMFVVPLSANPPEIETRTVSSTSSVANWTCVANVGYRIELFLQEPRVDVSFQLRVVPPQ